MPWLNRGAIGFCAESLIGWHEREGRPHCLFKLRMTRNLRRAIAAVKEEDGPGCSTPGVVQTAEIDLQ
ncbi:MAG: hypothetical protein EA425_00780 [Puniceicoccaceae bacterium]|nr:MAG: hypothetical protein EA425_00780 [Puniceicoccaceae bacterium]